MGAGARLASAGPGLFVIYGICGGFVFLILRALGELVLHRPASGSLVSYAREFFGEKAALRCGLDVFPELGDGGHRGQHRDRELLPLLDRVPGRPTVDARTDRTGGSGIGQPDLGEGLRRVRILGGADQGDSPDDVPGRRNRFLAGRFKIEGKTTGPHIWADHGGFLPTGLLPLVLVTSGVIFAYAAVELVGTAAGETADPEKVMPRAINSVIARIAVFYCGSVLLLALLLPYTTYKHGESPFVTFFSHIGFSGAGTLMNVVVSPPRSPA